MKLGYAVSGVRFAIDADGSIAQEIARTVMPVSRSAVPRGGPVFAVRSDHGRFSVFRGRRRLWFAPSKAVLVPWLEAEVVQWLLGRLRRYVQLHAAAVERRGRAVVIAGGPESGKTSLACALGLAGWHVMSDEVALIEPRSSTVASFPRSMLVKSGTARRLPDLLRVKPHRVVLDDRPTAVRYVSPAFAGDKARGRAAVSALAFPVWSRRSSVGAIGERDALERLLRASFNTASRPALSVDTCVGLVRNAELFRVSIGKLRESARLLSEAVEAGK